jgi:hypothetical protein
MTTRFRRPALVLGATLLFAGPAASLDSKNQMLCAMSDAFECTRGKTCDRTELAEIGAPRFFLVDMAQQVAQGIGAAARQRRSPIRTIDRVGPLLVMQGVDDAIEGERGAIGWTASVAMNGGSMVLTASGEDGAIIVYGDCLVEK